MSPLDHAVQIGAILDSLDIPWVLGGSMASSFVGEPRSTVDIDVAIQIRVDQVTALVDAVKRDYYVSEATVRHSLGGGSFNLIHFESNTILRVQGDRIDRDALHEVATELGLVDLLRTAIAEADR